MVQIATLDVKSCGNKANNDVIIATSLPVSRFILFTLIINALARFGSSMSRIPVPSTSQRPDWARFHKPVFADLVYPIAKNSG